jgi:hypothetical protein
MHSATERSDASCKCVLRRPSRLSTLQTISNSGLARRVLPPAGSAAAG